MSAGSARAASLRSVLLASDVPHAVSAPGLVAHFYVAPASRAGARLAALLHGRPFVAIERWIPPHARAALGAARRDASRLEPCLDLLLGSLLRAAPATRPARDPRVAAVLRILHREEEPVPLAALARRTGLSPDRLRHLFRRETGLTLRRYRLWLRLVRSLGGLERGASVTEAALEAGFADAAHLSRAFRRSFSFPPSTLLRDSRFVQASRSEPA